MEKSTIIAKGSSQIFQNITKVVFATNFEGSGKYYESLNSNSLLMDPRVEKEEPPKPLLIDMSDGIRKVEPDGAIAYIIKNGGDESVKETYELVISTTPEHPSTIIAQEGSLRYMFEGMKSLEYVSFSRDSYYDSYTDDAIQLLDTSCCTSTSYMFRSAGRNADGSEYNLNQLDTSSVIDFSHMFDSCRVQSL